MTFTLQRYMSRLLSHLPSSSFFLSSFPFLSSFLLTDLYYPSLSLYPPFYRPQSSTLSPLLSLSLSMANAPDRFALFILSQGEKRATIIEDPRLPNAATILLHKEDHTLGNMLRHSVLQQPGIRFCGYRIPHPLEPDAELRIQTDGKDTPTIALKKACENVIATTTKTKEAWRKECQMFAPGRNLTGFNNNTAGANQNGTGMGGVGNNDLDGGQGYVDI